MELGTSSLLALGALLSVLSFVLLFTTSFVKISIVLGLLRNAVGVQETPSGLVIAGVSMVLTAYVMYPVGSLAWKRAAPAVERLAHERDPQERISLVTSAFSEGLKPLRSFLVLNSSERTRERLTETIRSKSNEIPSVHSVVVAAPAFLLDEISSAFRMAFFLFLPFLVVDLIVAAATMSLGIHMLNPTVIALPFKLMLFAAVDGFALVSQALLAGYSYPA